MTERERALINARSCTLRELLNRIFYGSWQPGVDDQVVFEKIEELENK